MVTCTELTAGVDLTLEAGMFSLLPGDDLGGDGLSLRPLRLVAEDNVAQQNENYRHPGHLGAELEQSWSSCQLYISTHLDLQAEVGANTAEIIGLSEIFHFEIVIFNIFITISNSILTQSKNMNNFIKDFCRI